MAEDPDFCTGLALYVLWRITRNFYSRDYLIAGDQPSQKTEDCLRGLITERNLAAVVKMWFTTLVPCHHLSSLCSTPLEVFPSKGTLSTIDSFLLPSLSCLCPSSSSLLFWKHFQNTEEFFEWLGSISEHILALNEHTDGCIKYNFCLHFFSIVCYWYCYLTVKWVFTFSAFSLVSGDVTELLDENLQPLVCLKKAVWLVRQNLEARNALHAVFLVNVSRKTGQPY